MEHIVLNINGRDYGVEVEKDWSVLFVLREVLRLTGTKCGCSTHNCGACKIIVNGKAIGACAIKAVNQVGKKIETIEGLCINGEMHPLQQAFIDCGAVQCGYCTPGMIMSAKALLDQNLNPTDEDIQKALAHNLCRCTGYVKIVDAIKEAARRMRESA